MSTLNELGLNRLLTNSTSGVSSSDDTVVLNSMNSGSSSSGLDEAAAPGILTGTVITACLFRSTDQANRIEIQNNDIKIFDSSTGGGGTVTGDTASISFLKSRDQSQGFVMDIRAGKNNNNENVWELYALPNHYGQPNYIYVGKTGNDYSNTDTSYIEFDANIDTSRAYSASNGAFLVQILTNHIAPPNPNIGAYDMRLYGAGLHGVAAGVVGSGTDGFGGFGWQGIDMWADSTYINVGKNMVPQTDDTYDIGTISLRFKDFYSKGSLYLSGLLANSNTTRVRAAPLLITDTDFILPPNNGSNTYILQTDGTGVTTWVAKPTFSQTYPGSGIALSDGSSWSSSITNNSSNWNTAYSWGNHASAGYALLSGATFTGTILADIKPYQAGTSQVGYSASHFLVGYFDRLGNATNKVQVYCNGLTACPLPIAENALTKLKTTSHKKLAKGKGHYGDDVKYLDIPDAPAEMKKMFEDENGEHEDIDIIKTTAFLYSCMKEMHEEIELLKSKVK